MDTVDGREQHGRAPVDIHPPDLVLPGSIGRKNDVATVRRNVWLQVTRIIRCKLEDVSPVEAGDTNMRQVVLDSVKNDPVVGCP